MEIEVLKLNLPFDDPDVAYVYLLNSEVLVDAGFVSSNHAKLLEDTGAKAVVVTHHHVDHVGLLFFSNVLAYVHPHEYDFVRMYSDPEKFLEMYREQCRKFGIPLAYVDTLQVFKALKLEVKARITFSANFRNIEIIHSPGHTPGHVCVYCDAALFSGDAVMKRTTPHVGYFPGFSSVRSYIATLRRLAALEPEVIYPAHERPIDDAQDCIQALVDHYESRIYEVLSCVASKPTSVEEVARGVSWSAGDYDELDALNRLLAVTETLAYLQYLVEEGKVKMVEDETVKFRKLTVC